MNPRSNQQAPNHTLTNSETLLSKPHLAQCCFGASLDGSRDLGTWTSKSLTGPRLSTLSHASLLTQALHSINHFGPLERERKNGFLFLGTSGRSPEVTEEESMEGDKENSRNRSRRATQKLRFMKSDIREMMRWRRTLEIEKLKRFDWRDIVQRRDKDN